MSCILSGLKKGLRLTDFFYSTHLLRFQRQNEHRTVTGGFISLAIIVVMIAGFANMIVDTLNLSTIIYTNQVQKETEPSQAILSNDPLKYSMFAIELSNFYLQQFNLSSSVRYFDLIATHVRLEEGVPVDFQTIELETCTRDHWKSVQSLLQKFDKLGVSNWLCPKIGQNISLQGKYSSKKGALMGITASPCKNDTDPNRLCASPDQIEQMFIVNRQMLTGRIFYINTIINPNQPKFLSYYIEDMAYFSFSRKIGAEIYLSFSTYHIETDNSIWPFEDRKIDEGYLTEDNPAIYPFFRFNDQSQYFSFYFAKSDNKLNYFRQVQKISSVFSYIGGLIGAIIAFLFIINSFTNFSYQVTLASSIFSNNNKISSHLEIVERDTKQKEKEGEQSITSPSILDFIKLGVYELFKVIWKKPDWSKSERISQFREEILHQLNIRSILNRLIFIQFCIGHIFENYELYQLQKARPTNHQKIKQIRQKMDSERFNTEENKSILDSSLNNSRIAQNIKYPNKNQIIIDSNRSIEAFGAEQQNVAFKNEEKDRNIQISSINTMKQQMEKPDHERILRLKRLEQDLEKRKSFTLLKNQSLNGNKISSRIMNTVINNRQSFLRDREGEDLNCKKRQFQFNEQRNIIQQIPVLFAKRPRNIMTELKLNQQK